MLVIAHKIVSKAEGRIRGLRGRRGRASGPPSSRDELEQGPAPRPGRARRVARGAARHPRRADLRHPPRLRVRQRRRRRVERSRRGDRRAPPRRPGRLGARDPSRLKQLTGAAPAITDHRLVRPRVAPRPGRRRDRLRRTPPLEDWRGRTDATGRELKATWIAVADELAAAADLARTKDGSLAGSPGPRRRPPRHRRRRTRRRGADPPRGGGPVPVAVRAAIARGARGPPPATSDGSSSASTTATPTSCRALGDSPRISAASATDPTGWTVSISDVMRRRQPRQRGRDQQPADHLRGQREHDQPADARPAGDQVARRR